MSEEGGRLTAPLAADGPQDPDRRRDGILSHTHTHTHGQQNSTHTCTLGGGTVHVVTQLRGQTKVLSLISGCIHEIYALATFLSLGDTSSGLEN